MPFDTNIPDLTGYNAQMEKSMIDKLFFLDKTDATLFVDFGCADGALIEQASKLFPNYYFVGYDISQEMLDLAQKRLFQTVWQGAHIYLTSNWDKLVKNITGKSALILSSVLHEIYSYLNPDEIESFWDKVWNSGFDYIIIRDMMVSESTSRQSDPLAVAMIKQRFNKQKIKQWESQWGSLHDNWSLVHFLLTYRYDANWEREYRENYLPNSLETFLTMIPKTYSPTFFDHFTLTHLRNCVKKDFGLQLQDRTHLKLILERN